MHVEYARPWVLVSMAILGSDLVVRALKLRIRTATLVSLGEGANSTTKLSIPSLQSGWNTGQHIWIRRLSGLSTLEVHPFSIAHSADLANGINGKKGALTVYAKSCGDWTKSLNEAAESDVSYAEKKVEPASCKVVLEGPYGGQLLSTLHDRESVMLLAGGSGVSPCLSNIATTANATIGARSRSF